MKTSQSLSLLFCNHSATPYHFPLSQDFNVVTMPLMEEEVRGLDKLSRFAHFLLEPYCPPDDSSATLELKGVEVAVASGAGEGDELD